MLSIVHLEMLNALLAVKMWAQDWADTSVCMYCDNRAVVGVISSGRSKDEYLGACARNIWLLLAKYNIKLQVKHIEGIHNVNADILSRWFHFANKDNVNVNALKQCVWRDVPDFMYDCR